MLVNRTPAVYLKAVPSSSRITHSETKKVASARLILLGAGHAHLLLTERLDQLREAGIAPTLIAPRWFAYSGLATGVLSGALPHGANRIDVAELAQRCGLAFVEGLAVGIDRGARTVSLADGSTQGYDLLSLNIGSVVTCGIEGGQSPFRKARKGAFPSLFRPAPPAQPPIYGTLWAVGPGERDGTGCFETDSQVWPVKPLTTLAALREYIAIQPRFPSILIVGTGPSGTEIAAALLGLAERMGAVPQITLAGRTPCGGRAWRALLASLERRGLRLHRDASPVPPHDLTIAATGLAAPGLVREAGLATTAGGGAAIAATLQSVVDPAIFAVGDCADFVPRALPRQGVFGVRQAPVLARNLVAAAQGRPLERYRPQRRWLAIMDLGDETGFATWGPFALRSRLMLRWKRRLDRSFLRRFA